MKTGLYAVGAMSGLGKPLNAAPESELSPGRQPNLLFLLPDQWRFDWMNDNPELPIKTPNIDRIANRGIRFKQAMVAAPVCGPSRACIATGMEYDHAHTPSNAYDFPQGRPSFYKKLRNAGYHTMACGKMDLAKGSNWWGIDGKWKLPVWGYSDGINNAGKWDQLGGLNFNNGKPADPYLTFLQSRNLLGEHLRDYRRRQKDDYGSTFPTPLPDDAYCDNWITENALNLLDTAPEKPWFLQVNWAGPHDPEDITVGMEKTVRGLRMPPVNGQNKFSPAVNQTIRQNYTAMCENIDRGIGKLLDKLEASGQAENTLIIFSSDHGEMLGDLDRWGKSVPYQPSVGVPLVIAGPGVQSGIQNSALISSIDLAATFLDYGGCSIADIDGRTIRPILEGQTRTHREVLYSGLGAWRLAFNGQYKVITGFDRVHGRNSADISMFEPEVLTRPPIVFDLIQDPGENHDISRSMPSAAQVLLASLRKGTYSAQ